MTLLNVTKRSALSIAIGFFYPEVLLLQSLLEERRSGSVDFRNRAARLRHRHGFSTLGPRMRYCNKGVTRSRAWAGLLNRLRGADGDFQQVKLFGYVKAVLPRDSAHSSTLHVGAASRCVGSTERTRSISRDRAFHRSLSLDRDTFYNRITLNALFFPPGWTR